MVFGIVEVKYINRFLKDEVPKSLGLVCPSEKIRGKFKINPKNGIWRNRKKK